MTEVLVASCNRSLLCLLRLLLTGCNARRAYSLQPVGRDFSAILGDMIGRRTSLGLCGSQVPYMVYNGDRLLLLQ